MLAAIADGVLEHAALVRASFVLLVVAGPFVAWALVGRPRLGWALALASALPVAAVTLVPVDRQLFGRCELEWSLPTPGRVEILANVVLFIAPVLLAAVAIGRPLLVLVGGIIASLAIEALQAGVLALGRSCSTTDWLANAIGAGIGAGLAAAGLALARRASDQRGRRRPR